MFSENNRIIRSLTHATAAVCLLSFISACQSQPRDPTLAAVSGTVTLNGIPLPNARVFFQPNEHNRPSSARTDSNGNYSLLYTASMSGAKVGSHTVIIKTSGDNEDGSKSPELVPKKYFTKEAQLTAKVEPGNNTINFNLDSK